MKSLPPDPKIHLNKIVPSGVQIIAWPFLSVIKQTNPTFLDTSPHFNVLFKHIPSSITESEWCFYKCVVLRMLRQRNQSLSLLVPCVLLCDKSLPAWSSAIIVLTAPLVLNLIYVPWVFFSHCNSQAIPCLLPELRKHQGAQAQF